MMIPKRMSRRRFATLYGALGLGVTGCAVWATVIALIRSAEETVTGAFLRGLLMLPLWVVAGWVGGAGFWHWANRPPKPPRAGFPVVPTSPEDDRRDATGEKRMQP